MWLIEIVSTEGFTPNFCGGGVAGFAEARVSVEILADYRTKDAFVVTFAHHDACRAVGTFFEHELLLR